MTRKQFVAYLINELTWLGVIEEEEGTRKTWLTLKFHEDHAAPSERHAAVLIAVEMIQ